MEPILEDENLANPTSPSRTVPAPAPAPRLRVPGSRRAYSYLTAFAVVALLSTVVGFLAARFQGAFANWLEIHPVAAADAKQQGKPSLASTPQPLTKNDLAEISRLAPQQQAERLLELAVK